MSAERIRKKDSGIGSVGYALIIAAFMIILLVVILMFSRARLVTHQHDIDDALADSVLGSLVAKDEGYAGKKLGGESSIRFKDVQVSYDGYVQAMKTAIANTSGMYFKDEDRTPGVIFDTYVAYDVDKSSGKVDVYTFDGEACTRPVHETKDLEGLRTPGNGVVKETSAYAKVSFYIYNDFGKYYVEKSRDVYCKLEDNVNTDESQKATRGEIYDKKLSGIGNNNAEKHDYYFYRDDDVIITSGRATGVNAIIGKAEEQARLFEKFVDTETGTAKYVRVGDPDIEDWIKDHPIYKKYDFTEFKKKDGEEYSYVADYTTEVAVWAHYKVIYKVLDGPAKNDNYATEVHLGRVGSKVTPTPRDIDGYTTPEAKSAIVKGDSSTTIVYEYHYSKGEYTIVRKLHHDNVYTIIDRKTYEDKVGKTITYNPPDVIGAKTPDPIKITVTDVPQTIPVIYEALTYKINVSIKYDTEDYSYSNYFDVTEAGDSGRAYNVYKGTDFSGVMPYGHEYSVIPHIDTDYWEIKGITSTAPMEAAGDIRTAVAKQDNDVVITLRPANFPYTVRLFANGGTFNYSANADGGLVKGANGASDISLLHHYYDKWNLPWADGSNKSGSQDSPVVERGGCRFLGWSVLPVSLEDGFGLGTDYVPDFTDAELINVSSGEFKDKVDALKDKHSDAVLDFCKKDGEVRLYAVWSPVRYVVRYHSASVQEDGTVSGSGDKAYIDTNGGKFYTNDKWSGKYSAVTMPTNASDDAVGSAIRAAFGMENDKDLSYFRSPVPKEGALRDEEEAFWSDDAKVTANLTKEGLKRIKGYNAFAIGVTTKNTENITDIGNRSVTRGTWGCPKGLSAYIDGFAYVKGAGGKYADVAVVDMYCEYANAIKVTWDGNAKYGGTTYTKTGLCHYGESVAMPNDEFQKKANNTLEGWDIDPEAIFTRKPDGTREKDKDGNDIRDVKNLAHKAADGKISYGDMAAEAQSDHATYYAQWTLFNWQIRYNANGGTGSMSNTIMNGDEAKNLAKNAYKNGTKVFAGWEYERNIYGYTGKAQTFTVKKSGWYYVECWGADGGYGSFGYRGLVYKDKWSGKSFISTGGKGGYTAGKVYLKKGDVLTINVGHYGGHAGTAFGTGGGTTREWAGEGGGMTSVKIGNSYLAAAGGGGGANGGDSSDYWNVTSWGYAGGNGNSPVGTVSGTSGEKGYFIGDDSSHCLANGGGGQGWHGGAHNPVQTYRGTFYSNWNENIAYYTAGQAQGGQGYIVSNLNGHETENGTLGYYGESGFIKNPSAVQGYVEYDNGYFRTASNNTAWANEGRHMLETNVYHSRSDYKNDYYCQLYNGYCRISGLFTDQQEVSATDFYEISGNKVKPNEVKDIYAYWAPEVIPSAIVGIQNVPYDMEEYYDEFVDKDGNTFDLTKYEYDESHTDSGGKQDRLGLTITAQKNDKGRHVMTYKGGDIVLPDLSMDKDGKTQIHDGFIGWQYYDYGKEETVIARSAVLKQDTINGVRANGQKFIFTALWADHYAASIWGIDHDYNIYGVTNNGYGKPNYNKSDVQFNAGSSNHGVTFGAALGYAEGVTGTGANRKIASNDFDTKYVRHNPSSGKGCVHDDYIKGGWALIKKNIEDKGGSYYSECLDKGCTVPMFFVGNQTVNELGNITDATIMVSGVTQPVLNGGTYDFNGYKVVKTNMYASTGKGDGYTSIKGGEADTSYLTSAQNPVPDDPGHYGATAGGNYYYKAYNESNMPVAMNKIYNALLNPDLKSMIGETPIVYATNSKDDTKGLNNLNYHNGTWTAPTIIDDSSTTYSPADMWWLDHIDNSGYTGTIVDNRSGNVIGNKKAYTYGTTTAKLFIPSAREIYGDCSRYRGGDAYNNASWGNTTQEDSAYVLDFFDGNQFEKFRGYSFIMNLWNTNTYTSFGQNKDTARLNSTGGVITRTPGSSNTKARLTNIDSNGALNTTRYTKGTYGLAPCFRCE